MFTNVSPTPGFYFTFTILVSNPLIVGDGNLKVMAHNNVQVGILLAFHCINIRLLVRRCVLSVQKASSQKYNKKPGSDGA